MRPGLFVTVVVLSAFTLRVGFTIAFRGGLETVPVREIAGADSVEYDSLARNVADGKGYTVDGIHPTAFRAPGFPLVLAVVYAGFGVSYPWAYLAMAFFGALGTIAAYLLMRELCGEKPARWAAVFAALYPPSVFDSSYFYSEVVFAPCLGFGLWLVARHVRTASFWAVAGGGLVLGYAALTRSFGVIFLPLFATYLCFSRPSGWRGALVFSIAFMAAIAPWTIRNYLVFHQPVLIATNGGSTFYGANNDLVTGSPREFGNWVSTTRLPGRDLIEAQSDEVNHDRMEWKLGIDWVMHNPGKFLVLAPAKVIRFWTPFISYPSFKRYAVVNVLLMVPFLALIVLGIIRTLLSRPGRKTFAVAHLTLLANCVMVVIFWGEPRFRDANVPVLAVYAVAGLWWARTRTDVFCWPQGEERLSLQTRIASGPGV